MTVTWGSHVTTWDAPDVTWAGGTTRPPAVVASGRLPSPLTLVPPKKKRKRVPIVIPDLPPLAPEPVALASLTDDEFFLLLLS